VDKCYKLGKEISKFHPVTVIDASCGSGWGSCPENTHMVINKYLELENISFSCDIV
jgi:hypothetical protein